MKIITTLFLIGWQAFCPAQKSLGEHDMDQTPFNFQEVLEKTQATKTVSPQFVHSSDGLKLATYRFVPSADPSHVLVFYHGAGFWCSDLYQKMAQQYAVKKQAVVYLIDMRGHGNSEGVRGDACSKEVVWQDVDQVIAWVKKKHPKKSITLGGHSSGAGLVLLWNAWKKKKEAADQFLFLAPYLGPRSGTEIDHKDPAKRFIKKVSIVKILLHVFTGGLLFPHTPVLFFNYPDWLYKQDPFTLKYYTNAMLSATSIQDCSEVLQGISKPATIYLAGNDELFDIPKSLAVLKRYLKSSDNQKVIVVEKARHLSVVYEFLKLLETS